MRRKAGFGAMFAVVAVLLTAPGALAFEIPGVDQIHTSAASTYEALPAKGLVRVNVTMKVTNNIPDFVTYEPCIQYYWDPYWGNTPYSTTCPRTTHYYVKDTALWVEKEASQLKVSSGAGKVKVKKGKDATASFKSYKLTFPKIWEGQTRTLKVSYVIRGGSPRSLSSVRMNGAYMNFWGISQPTDVASVKVVVPSSFAPTTWGGTVNASAKGGKTTFSSGSVADPTTFYVGVTGTDEAGFVETSIRAPSGREIRFQAWPGDSAWMGAVMGEATVSISKLEEMIGEPVPGAGPITLREVSNGDLGDAYIGAYDREAQLATISEDYSQVGTVSHELSHTWFNGSLFASQWMSEGYASWAERAVGANRAPCSDKPTSRFADPVNLSDWQYADPRATQAQLDAVDAQYTAACELISKVASDVGTDGMRAALAVMLTTDAAYPGTHDPVTASKVDWRQWLDALDEQGMAPAGMDSTHELADLLVTYGVATAGDLAGRQEARESLVELRSDAGRLWTVPSAVYGPMASWDFSDADQAMTQMTSTIDDARSVGQILPEVSPADSPLRDRVAAAATVAELVAVRQTADQQVAAATTVAAAIADANADRGPIEAIGLLGTDLAPMTAAAVDGVARLDFAGANAQATAIETTLEGASSAGVMRIGGVLGALLLALGVAFVVRRRRSVAAAPAAEVMAAAASSDDTTVVDRSPLDGELTQATELPMADPSPEAETPKVA